MRKAPLLLVIAIAVSLPAGAQHRRHDVVGYFPSWKWRADSLFRSPESIPFGKLTVINYAFFIPFPDGRLRGKDPSGDTLYLQSGRNSSAGSLTASAHRKGVSVVLSIGGWEDSDNFPALAADPVLAAHFAGSCASAIREFGFDGIDIDWEYPGYAEHRGTASDGKNFVRLLSVLRDTLDRVGAQRGRHLLLSAALPAGPVHAGPIPARETSRFLDFLNIMTYDFYGPWDPRAYHNAPLYAGPGADSALCVEGAFRLYHDTYGIPASRINLGVPFYGHTFTGCTELWGTHGPPDTAVFHGGNAVYAAIAGQIGRFTKHLDAMAGVPYLTSSALDMLVSYDDQESVREKARYVLAKGARGLIVWEITGDRLPDGSHPLLEAIDREFHESH
jgi:chitinase